MKIIVTAEIPEELLPDYRLFIVLHGGKVLVPREKENESNEQKQSN